MSEWAYQWKMSFNSDQNKQAKEIIFSRKITKSSHLRSRVSKSPSVAIRPSVCAVAALFLYTLK